MKTPEILFLQWHGDCHPEDCSNDDDVDPAGASWCWEKIFPADIEYVRIDKFNEVKKQRDEWQRQAEEIITERNKLEAQRDELAKELEKSRFENSIKYGISLPEMYKSEYEEQLEKQRDELLAALVSLAAVARRYLPDYDEHPTVQKADDAIAKAEG